MSAGVHSDCSRLTFQPDPHLTLVWVPPDSLGVRSHVTSPVPWPHSKTQCERSVKVCEANSGILSQPVLTCYLTCCTHKPNPSP